MSANITRDIYKIHFANKMLIQSYDIHIGNNYKLKPDFAEKYKTSYVTIESIDLHYGWITCKETKRIPRKVKLLIECFDFENKFVEPNMLYNIVFSSKDAQINTASEIFGAFGKKAKLNTVTKNIHYKGNQYSFVAYPKEM